MRKEEEGMREEENDTMCRKSVLLQLQWAWKPLKSVVLTQVLIRRSGEVQKT